MANYTLVLRNEKKRWYSRLAIFFTLVAIAGAVFYWWIAIFLIPVYLFYRIATRPFILKVEPDQIIFPSFPQRVISWNELSNMVLKDGLLTIDFRNNRIIQQALDPDAGSPVESEFNEFCRQHLTDR